MVNAIEKEEMEIETLSNRMRPHTKFSGRKCCGMASAGARPLATFLCIFLIQRKEHMEGKEC